MENEINDLNQNLTFDLPYFVCLSEFRKPLFKLIIKSLDLPNGSNGLDAGCGIGFFTKILAKFIGSFGTVIGVDVSKEFISYANSNKFPNIQFDEGDINSLYYKDNSFDWIWSADTVWPGPKEIGCPTRDISTIIKQFYRVLKPRGKIIILYWTSQKFLPGYPLLEARLNTLSGATAPFIDGMNPIQHIMNAKHWLANTGFKDISAKTFLADINAPLNDNTKNALLLFFKMLWGDSEDQFSEKDWEEYKRICDPNSSEYILNNKHYYGFYTYTLFSGVK
jgi:ubiquinone/menaquinone biosynthesis C-methylase UbiE